MRNLKSTCFILFLFILSVNTYSQSRYLENGIAGSAFKFNTKLSDSGLKSVGISAAYSIGGIMDIGLEMNRQSEKILTHVGTNWNLNFLYNIIVLKQSDYIPLSIQLEGKYGFTNVTSDTLILNTLEGQGFNLGISVFREFFSKKLISFLIGAKGSYSNFNYTEMDSSSTIISSDRIECFSFGGIVALSLKPPKWPIFTIEVEAFYNQTVGEISVEPSFLVIAPSY